ncbi:MAG: hypothetical protein JXL84_24315 [Deltaproteobacteria bacterium]|nr:hypothetical protein [Deltaproteobacteria bacterium]
MGKGRTGEAASGRNGERKMNRGSGESEKRRLDDETGNRRNGEWEKRGQWQTCGFLPFKLEESSVGR